MNQSEHQRRAYLEALGIDVWVPCAHAELVDEELAPEVETDVLDWPQLRDAVAPGLPVLVHALEPMR